MNVMNFYCLGFTGTSDSDFIIIIIIAVETLGVFNASARVLLDDLGRRIISSLGEARETSFLYQRVSVLIQRYNAVLLHDSLPSTDRTD